MRLRPRERAPVPKDLLEDLLEDLLAKAVVQGTVVVGGDMRWHFFTILLGLTFLLGRTAWADAPLVVAVKDAPPFVMVQDDGKVSGFSVELVEEIARRLDPPRRIQFEAQMDLEPHLDMVALGKADLGISATTITSERQQRLDFSQPFYRSGLGILVRPARLGIGVIPRMLSGEILWIGLGMILYILLCAHLIWWAERGSSAFNDKWLPGVATAVWWVIVSMSTVGYGDVVPKKTISKVLAVMVIFTGIGLFGVAVASFSSAMTVQTLQSDISSPADLKGRRVAVVINTTGALAVQHRSSRIIEVRSISEAAALVRDSKADAAVHDLPLLQHHVKTHPEDGLSVVDVLFEPANYGMTFPIGSNLRREVNVVLLQLTGEPSGFYAMLQQKWFGSVVE